MATSEVKRIIEPNKSEFKAGEIVHHTEYGVVLVTNTPPCIDTFHGVVLGGISIGQLTILRKEYCKPFKGSVTLTEA